MPYKHSSKKKRKQHKSPSSWDHVAKWYSGWTGDKGSKYQQQIAFPAVLKHINEGPSRKKPTKSTKNTKSLLDVGCGTGVFAAYLSNNIQYTGIDISKGMIKIAKTKSEAKSKTKAKPQQKSIFITGNFVDATTQAQLTNKFDYITFILSIQDMDDLAKVLKTAAMHIKNGGKLVIFMKHPAFGIPRQSGWIFDEKRKLKSRRVDRYLKEVVISLTSKRHNKTIKTYFYHRPIQTYINELTKNGFAIDDFKEIADSVKKMSTESDFPTFLLISANKT